MGSGAAAWLPASAWFGTNACGAAPFVGGCIMRAPRPHRGGHQSHSSAVAQAAGIGHPRRTSSPRLARSADLRSWRHLSRPHRGQYPPIQSHLSPFGDAKCLAAVAGGQTHLFSAPFRPRCRRSRLLFEGGRNMNVPGMRSGDETGQEEVGRRNRHPSCCRKTSRTKDLIDKGARFCPASLRAASVDTREGCRRNGGRDCRGRIQTCQV